MFIVFLNRDSVQIMLDLYLSIPIWVLLKWYYFSYFKFQLFITTILENNWLLDPETVQWNLEGLTRATYFVLLYEILWEITQIIMLFADKDGFISSFTHCTSLSHPQGGDWTQGRQHAGLALHQWASLQPRLYTFFSGLYQQYSVRRKWWGDIFSFISNCRTTHPPSPSLYLGHYP